MAGELLSGPLYTTLLIWKLCVEHSACLCSICGPTFGLGRKKFKKTYGIRPKLLKTHCIEKIYCVQKTLAESIVQKMKYTKIFFSFKSPWNHPLTYGVEPSSRGVRKCQRSRHFLVKTLLQSDLALQPIKAKKLQLY